MQTSIKSGLFIAELVCIFKIAYTPFVGADMNEVAMLRGTEARGVLQTAIEKQVPAVVSYSSGARGGGRKWHSARVLLTGLGAERISARLLPAVHPTNIRGAGRGQKGSFWGPWVGQSVGVSLKYGYGKFIFETKVVALGPPPGAAAGGTGPRSGSTEVPAIALAVPERVEVVQRRSYFRVDVPESLKVDVLVWRRGQNRAPCRARLIDISAGGAQVAVDAGQEPDFRKGQFIELRFTPVPYEAPLEFGARIRSILPTADGRSICLGLQIVGLEASPEGRAVLRRLCSVVERYYRMHQSSIRQQDMQPGQARSF